MTRPRALITLGCSWTYGVGVGWHEGMDDVAYRAVAWNAEVCDQLSWRGILGQKLGAVNVNLSSGGSSNQRQFRLARTYFSRPEFKSLLDGHDITVVWGITSTARNEMYDLDAGHLLNFSYSHGSDLSRALIRHSYEHQHEVFVLSQEMLHWNDFFEKLGVSNHWFDTFNHHDYGLPSPGIDHYRENYENNAGEDWPSWDDFRQGLYVNDRVRSEILDISRWDFASQVTPVVPDRIVLEAARPRDLMSQMCLAHGMKNPDENYHISQWEIDSNRVEFLMKLKLLNPISHHPTQLGHAWIADMLFDKINF